MRGVRVANVSFEVASGINGAVCACELGAVITGTSDHGFLARRQLDLKTAGDIADHDATTANE